MVAPWWLGGLAAFRHGGVGAAGGIRGVGVLGFVMLVAFLALLELVVLGAFFLLARVAASSRLAVSPFTASLPTRRQAAKKYLDKNLMLLIL